MPKVLGREIQRNRTGRPARVDITKFKDMVDENPGHWVEEIYDDNDAASARRQFQKLPGYEVMTSKDEESGQRSVLVRRGV